MRAVLTIAVALCIVTGGACLADEYKQLPASSEPIEIPANVPGRAPDSPAVSSISGPEAPAASNSTDGTLFTSATVSRAADRRFGFTVFNQLRRYANQVVIVMRRATNPR